MLLEDLYSMHRDHKANFSYRGHNRFELFCFKLQYAGLYWLSNRTYRSDMTETDGNIRIKPKYFLCWHQFEFHDMPMSQRFSLYFPWPRLARVRRQQSGTL